MANIDLPLAIEIGTLIAIVVAFSLHMRFSVHRILEAVKTREHNMERNTDQNAEILSRVAEIARIQRETLEMIERMKKDAAENEKAAIAAHTEMLTLIKSIREDAKSK